MTSSIRLHVYLQYLGCIFMCHVIYVLCQQRQLHFTIVVFSVF